jgi:hypothetical protein
MPKVSSIFSSSFLRAPDLDGPRDITIAGWRTEYLFGKDDYVLELESEASGLRLTATLARDIKAALDGEDDIDAWIGRVVTIYPSQMKIRDKDTGTEKLVDIIRAMASERDKAPDKPRAKALKKQLDDDIPF